MTTYNFLDDDRELHESDIHDSATASPYLISDTGLPTVFLKHLKTYVELKKKHKNLRIQLSFGEGISPLAISTVLRCKDQVGSAERLLAKELYKSNFSLTDREAATLGKTIGKA